MNMTLEAAKLQAIASLLAATVEDWHDVNLHSLASDLDSIEGQLKVLAHKLIEQEKNK